MLFDYVCCMFWGGLPFGVFGVGFLWFGCWLGVFL